MYSNKKKEYLVFVPVPGLLGASTMFYGFPRFAFTY